MKNIAVGVAIMVGAVVAPSVSKGAGAFVNDPKISLKSMQTPGDPTGDDDSPKGSLTPKQWLRIAFRFETPEERVGKQNKYKYEDDVTIRVEVLISTEYNGKSSFGLFSGESTYTGIMLDGKEHWTRFFIPPFYLERYLADAKKITTSNFRKDIQAKVTVINGARQTIGLVYLSKGKVVEHKEKGASTIAKRFKQASEAGVAQVQKHDGKVWGSDKTPWRFVSYDSYEVIKDEEGRR